MGLMVIGLIDGWKIIEECELHKVRVEGDLEHSLVCYFFEKYFPLSYP